MHGTTIYTIIDTFKVYTVQTKRTDFIEAERTNQNADFSFDRVKQSEPLHPISRQQRIRLKVTLSANHSNKYTAKAVILTTSSLY